MFVTTHDSHDQAWNLAMEEVLLTLDDGEWFLLWQNAPCVVIGRHQLAAREVDRDACQEMGVTVIRRKTGGGAVYHDLGNFNFTFVGKAGASVDFAHYNGRVAEFLQSLGLAAAPTGRNDIAVDGAKVSGNAQWRQGGRVLHHGTLLYDAELAAAARVLTPHQAKYQGRGVASVRSRIANIAALMANPLPRAAFAKALLDWMVAAPGASRVALPHHLCQQADAIAPTYREPAWVWGQEAAYTRENTLRMAAGTVTARLEIQDGTMTKVRLHGDFFFDPAPICQVLTSVAHEQEAIKKALHTLSDEQWAGVDVDEWVGLFSSEVEE